MTFYLKKEKEHSRTDFDFIAQKVVFLLTFLWKGDLSQLVWMVRKNFFHIPITQPMKLLLGNQDLLKTPSTSFTACQMEDGCG